LGASDSNWNPFYSADHSIMAPLYEQESRSLARAEASSRGHIGIAMGLVGRPQAGSSRNKIAQHAEKSSRPIAIDAVTRVGETLSMTKSCRIAAAVSSISATGVIGSSLPATIRVQRLIRFNCRNKSSRRNSASASRRSCAASSKLALSLESCAPRPNLPSSGPGTEFR